MAKLSGITATEMTWQEGSAPSTPASTKWKLYYKTDGLYVMDDAGAETGPLGTGGGGGIGDHGCRITNTAVQNLNNGSETLITFDTELKDTDGYHEGVTNPGRITIPSGQGGTYILTATLQFTSNSTGYRALMFGFNGTSTRFGRKLHAAYNGAATWVNISDTYDIAQGEYVELYAVCNTSSIQSIVTANFETPIFSAQRIA